MSKSFARLTDDKPILSTVVIGRNEGERLVRCLQSVIAMEQPPGGSVEIIYVDSASTDDSVARARQLGANVIQVNPKRPCASVGRNAGWRASRADNVLFLDGDTILARDFVVTAWPQFDDPSIAVVFGNRREIKIRDSIYNRVLDLDWIAPPGGIKFCGGDALIRRAVLDRVNGYDESLIAGEDAELCYRIRALGCKIVHISRHMTGHDLAIHRFSQYWRRSLRTGYAYAEISQKFRHSSTPVWSREAHRNLFHGALMVAIVVGFPILSLVIHSVIPIVAAIAITAALAIRTAIRSRWKCAGLGTRLAYGLHSHLGQIPIWFGQLKYQLNRWNGRTAKLIEYK
ncbi:MAG TPA: glycosyltransferase [Candidatus Binataceae bacterium]|nr:glycosyltransferase [Candidatus Binataceae bacterium]